MNRPPAIKITLEQLPLNPAERHEVLVDIFGSHLLWAMKEALKNSRTLVESAEARQKLGRIMAAPYAEAASTLKSEDQQIAFRLAEASLQLFARNLLFLLESRGIALKLGDAHAIQYRLTEEICDVENVGVQVEEIINREGKKAFADYLGHWLNEDAKGESSR